MIFNQTKSESCGSVQEIGKNHQLDNIRNLQIACYQKTSISNFRVKNQISQNEKFSEEEQNPNCSRTLKNCRKIIQWSSEEDELLFQKYIEIGPKWVELSTHFPQKCDNAVKNRFYSCLKKAHRKINIVQKEKKLKHRKLITFESLMTLLEIRESSCNTSDKRFQQVVKNLDQIMSVIRLIIELAKTPEARMNDQDVEIIIKKFIEVRHSLKFISAKRAKKVKKKINYTKNISTQLQSTIEESQNQAKTPKENMNLNQYSQHQDYNMTDNIIQVDTLLKQQLSNGNNHQENLVELYKDILSMKEQKQDLINVYFF